jgi:hypothetical protein
MKKPWVIGLMSVIPGLGFIVLGKTLLGLISFLIVASAALLTVVIPSEDASAIFFTLFYIAWFVQLFYAVFIALRLAHVEAGLVLQAKPVFIAPLPAGASLKDKKLQKTRQTMMELLPPGEYLQIALKGKTGNWTQALHEYPPDIRVIYFGTTEQDLIIIKTDGMGDPNELQRIPINKISAVKLVEGFLNDAVDFDVGENKPLRIYVSYRFRPELVQLVGVLSGTGQFLETPDYHSVEQLIKTSNTFGAEQAKNVASGVKKRVSLTDSPLFRQACVSFIFFLIGYVVSFGAANIFFSGFFQEMRTDIDFSPEVNIIVQLLCCGPAVIPTIIIIAALVILAQNKLKLSYRTTMRANAIVSTVIGFVLYIPAQFLVIFAATF